MSYDTVLQRTKPKGLIDLSCAYLYQVHDTFFDKKFCFQIVERALPCLATVTYLACEDSGEFEVRNLPLHIEDLFKSNLFCVLGLAVHAQANVFSPTCPSSQGRKITRSQIADLDHL